MITAWGESTLIQGFGKNIKFPYPGLYFGLLLKPLAEVRSYSLLRILHLFVNLWDTPNILGERKK